MGNRGKNYKFIALTIFSIEKNAPLGQGTSIFMHKKAAFTKTRLSIFGGWARLEGHGLYPSGQAGNFPRCLVLVKEAFLCATSDLRLSSLQSGLRYGSIAIGDCVFDTTNVRTDAAPPITVNFGAAECLTDPLFCLWAIRHLA